MDLSLAVDRGILFRRHELNERPKCSVILHCFIRHSISIWQNYHFHCSLYDCSVVFLPIYHKQTSSIIYQTKVDRNSCHSTEKAPQPSVLVDQVHASSRAVCMLLNNNWTAVQSSAFSGRHLCFFPDIPYEYFIQMLTELVAAGRGVCADGIFKEHASLRNSVWDHLRAPAMS